MPQAHLGEICEALLKVTIFSWFNTGQPKVLFLFTIRWQNAAKAYLELD